MVSTIGSTGNNRIVGNIVDNNGANGVSIGQDQGKGLQIVGQLPTQQQQLFTQNGSQTHQLSVINVPVKVPSRSTPDFTLVYSYISSLFDRKTVQDEVAARQSQVKLQDMEPIDRETVLLLLKNLTSNLQSPNVWREHIKILQKGVHTHRDPNGLHDSGTTTPSNGQNGELC